MKYLCLVYGEEQALANMPDSHCLAYDEEIRRSGHCIASEALQPVATATTVRASSVSPFTRGPSRSKLHPNSPGSIFCTPSGALC